MKNLYLKTITAITVTNIFVSSALADDTGKASDISGVVSNAKKSIETIPALIRVICYIAALVFGISGVMKLKEYMDQPGKTPITGAIGRLLVGAFLVAIPTVLATITASTTGTGSTLTVDKFNLK